MPDWKNTPNENGELPVVRATQNPWVRLLWETYNFPDGKNDDRWYHWCIENWDTKWEADMQELRLKTMTHSKLHLIPHGVHPKES